MSAPIIMGKRFVLGSAHRLPLRNFPEGKTRIRVRPNHPVRVYVRTSFGIWKFLVQEVDGFWEPLIQEAFNARPQIRTIDPLAMRTATPDHKTEKLRSLARTLERLSKEQEARKNLYSAGVLAGQASIYDSWANAIERCEAQPTPAQFAGPRPGGNS
jgi:hypothetical protein